MSKNGEILIVGLGYVGHALARALEDLGIPWVGLRRQLEGNPRIRCVDLDAEVIDLADVDTRRVVYLAPPPKDSEGDPRLRRVLEALDERPPDRFVYASTTGVYGNQDGAEVDENAPLRAATARALRRLDAEQALVAACERWGTRWAVLRLPGIYGPGRLREEQIRAGLQVPCPEICPPGNRIHRDDIVDVILRLLEDDAPTGFFNLADNEHMSSTDFARTVADRIGVELPPCIPDLEAYYAAHPGMASFLREQRRIDSSRIRKALNWSPRYDTALAGIAASLRD
ncbi:NAD-dependent epimerase/dehydratase family protein [Thioalkalivibrio sp.]|uniref:NAD-dependent epimerase/dehydratase family protein n=1 Tax=Thioalkalivibrio sp. TaxID=2093813 RepID=UPI0012D58D39|nr:NAD-dependent epimerase/dehydratase family protein [Thioalkalivibrio sp.]TVP76122.1 MAG: NAD-dependent epimerase/dehydratase family protein [Thioalkalivibrio sp.]